MGTNKNSNNIPISHDITSEEKKRLERKKKKREKEWKTREKWISPLTRKTKRVNKNRKLVRKFEWTN